MTKASAAAAVAETLFRHAGATYVALAYADAVAFDLVVYRRDTERFRGPRGWRARYVYRHAADGYLVWGAWVRDHGDKRAWAAACAAIVLAA